MYGANKPGKYQMNKLKSFFEKSNNVMRDSYIWNTLSASIYAMQSAIVLIVITHTTGLEDAGIFSIAYAVASLMYYIGEYGVRKYQVSDINEEMSFTDYHSHRIVACVLMLAVSLGYVANGYLRLGYSPYKAYIVLVICLTKVVEAYSEVYFGRFQQVGRLDVSAKTNFYRIMVGVIGCIIALIVTKDMAVSMTVWLVLCVFALLTSNILVYKDFGTFELKFRWDKIKRIFIECFALFAGYFLLLYVGNAPKYAIDACMSDVDQACYNFIFMPVFAIGMFANFIFNPILVKLAHRWDENKINVFTRIVVRQIFVIFGITLLAIAVALTIGPPILGILFNADLADYKTDLAILMIGGGMLALVNFFAVVVTVMRYQKHLITGYVVLAVAAWFMANRVVRTYGIRGATVLYTILMALLALIFAGLMFYFISRRSREVRLKKA